MYTSQPALGMDGFSGEDLVQAARAVVEHPQGERFRLDGPRQLIELRQRAEGDREDLFPGPGIPGSLFSH